MGRSCISLGQQVRWSPNLFLWATQWSTLQTFPELPPLSWNDWGPTKISCHQLYPWKNPSTFRSSVFSHLVSLGSSGGRVEFQESSSPDQRPWSRLCLSHGKKPRGTKDIRKLCCCFFFWGGGRLFLKIGSFVETKPMLPDEWFYSFWLNKFVDCAVLQQKLFVFFLCFVFQCYRHDITCRLWQFIRGFQWVPESMRQFAGTTVITDCNFWCRNVGCNILHCNTALLDVFSRSLGAPYRGEFDSKSMFPFLQNSKYIIPTPSSFKKR